MKGLADALSQCIRPTLIQNRHLKTTPTGVLYGVLSGSAIYRVRCNQRASGQVTRTRPRPPATNQKRGFFNTLPPLTTPAGVRSIINNYRGKKIASIRYYTARYTMYTMRLEDGLAKRLSVRPYDSPRL